MILSTGSVGVGLLLLFNNKFKKTDCFLHSKFVYTKHQDSVLAAMFHVFVIKSTT